MLARRRAGISQTAAGARLGITAAAFSDLERGRTRAHVDNLAAIADVLGVPLSAIVTLERQPHLEQPGGSGDA